MMSTTLQTTSPPPVTEPLSEPSRNEHMPSPSFPQIARTASRYAHEDSRRSWLAVLPTLFIVVGIQVSLLLAPPIWLAPLLSTALILFLVRVFIFYHDVLHRALFRNSRLGRLLILPFSIYFIYPPWIWRDRHLDHHRKNCRIDDVDVDGQVPLYSAEHYQQQGRLHRLAYRLIRSWPGMILGYIPFFLVPVMMAAKRQPWAVLWPLVQIGLMVAGAMVLGFGVMFWAFIYPVWIATILGTVLFFIQHNAPGLHFNMPKDWDYGHAAMNSSTFLDLPRWQHWITGNIGYHHIHHINDRIPFYRLPEVMADIPELQEPVRVRFTLGALHNCLRLQLWDPNRGRLISMREHRGGHHAD